MRVLMATLFLFFLLPRADAMAEQLRCTFSTGVMTDVASEFPETVENPAGAPLLMVFERIDAQAGTARVFGNAAPEGVPVLYVRGAQSASFFEVTPYGNVNTTTVFDGAGTRALAVHSRHFAFEGSSPLVSQLFGFCIRA
jgi:hypothetical protein